MKAFRIQSLTLSLLVLILAGCASGSAIVTGDARGRTAPEDVKLYLEAPKNYDVIGVVKASSGAGWSEQASKDYAIKELKKQAARMGANGVILETNKARNFEPVPEYGTGYFYSRPASSEDVSGSAIYVYEYE